MFTRKIILLIIIIIPFIATSQSLEGNWLFNNEETFISDNNGIIKSEIFNFFNSYTISQDTLKITHVYPKAKCITFDKNDKKITIPCPDNSIPNSIFKIIKFTTDSLYLQPINRSAIAISERLKNRGEEQFKKIVFNNYDPKYFRTIKLYNSKTLYEKIEWVKIRISTKSNGWFQEYNNYIEIHNDGKFQLMQRIKPYKSGKPSKKYRKKTTFYKDSLTSKLLNELNTNLNYSGIFQFKIRSFGYSSHGTIMKIQIETKNKKIIKVGYFINFPKTAEPFLKSINKIIENKKYKKSKIGFKIPKEFKYFY